MSYTQSQTNKQSITALMIEGCRTRGEGREGTAATSTSCFTFFPKLGLSNFLLPARGPRQGQRRPGNTDRERRTEKKMKVRKSLANQSKVNFLFSFPSLAARSRSVGVQGTHSTSPVPTKSEAEHEANGEKERKPTTMRRNSRHKSHSLQAWSQVWWLGGKAPLVTPPPLHRRSRRS